MIPPPPIPATTFYDILGLETGATTEEVRKAYKHKALETHPDKLPPNITDEEKAAAEDSFRKVCDAFQILSDARKRENYDVYFLRLRQPKTRATSTYVPTSSSMNRPNPSTSASYHAGSHAGSAPARPMPATPNATPRYATSYFTEPISPPTSPKRPRPMPSFTSTATPSQSAPPPPVPPRASAPRPPPFTPSKPTATPATSRTSYFASQPAAAVSASSSRTATPSTASTRPTPSRAPPTPRTSAQTPRAPATPSTACPPPRATPSRPNLRTATSRARAANTTVATTPDPLALALQRLKERVQETRNKKLAHDAKVAYTVNLEQRTRQMQEKLRIAIERATTMHPDDDASTGNSEEDDEAADLVEGIVRELCTLDPALMAKRQAHIERRNATRQAL